MSQGIVVFNICFTKDSRNLIQSFKRSVNLNALTVSHLLDILHVLYQELLHAFKKQDIIYISWVKHHSSNTYFC